VLTVLVRRVLAVRAMTAGSWLCFGGATLGALGLLGWISGLSALTTIVPNLPPMMPNTGLALLLLGSAGAARQRADTGLGWKVFSIVAALLALAVGIGTLVETGLSIDPHIDDLLVRSRGLQIPLRPSSQAATAISCLACAILFLDIRATARFRPSEWLVLCAGLIAFTALTGIVVGAQPLVQMATGVPLIGLSVPTAVSLLLTSMGLLLARPAAGIMRVATSPDAGSILLRRMALPVIAGPVVLGLVAGRFFATAVTEQEIILVALLTTSTAAVGLFLLFVSATPLNRAHRDLEASRTQTRSLVDQAPDGIFLADTEGRYINVNDAGCRMLGCSRAEIVGKTIVDFIPPQDVERLWQARDLLLTGVPQVAEWTLRRKDGVFFPVEIGAKILPGGRWQAFVRDISERKRVESEQRFLAEFGMALSTTLDYEEIVSRIAEVATRQFADLCIVDVIDEEGAVRRLKVAARNHSSNGMCEWLQRLSPDRSPGVRSALTSKQPTLVTHFAPEDIEAPARNDDQRQPLLDGDLQSAVVVPLVAAGRLLGAITFLSVSRTRLFKNDDLLVAGEFSLRAALALDNARLYRAARRAIHARDEVLGFVAHDLRNPLSVILAEARLMELGGPERRARPPGKTIEQAAGRMNRLIQDLLDVSRIEARQLTLDPGPIPVAQLVSDAVDVFRGAGSSTAIELRLAVSPDVPEIWGDRDRLLQVFENLLGNALKFTAPGGSVTVGAAPQGSHVLFWVDDTGPGIATEDQPYVFDRFWRARPEKRSGAGLGLPIVKGIVEAHGGRIWVQSDPGRGSTFLFTIPQPATAL
jgi:PAS domain S-box-containing protein